MHPQADTLWRGPRWGLALLLACLGMLGPFSIDTYLPAFGPMAVDLQATPAQMQQTLSAYLGGFALMNLFHGALSDSLGRRTVVVAAMWVFALASLGCALAPDFPALLAGRVLQGMSAGAGMVISRAVIRDLFAPEEAQRVMSQVTLFFGVAPAVAPLIGGLLVTHSHWRGIFVFLALLGAVLALQSARRLPETLPPAQRRPFHPLDLLQGYARLGGSARFLTLVLAGAVPFNGMFIYVLSAPAWLGGVLHLAPTQYFWFFALTVSGVMAGGWWSGRLAGRVPPLQQIKRGFVVMGLATGLNLLVQTLPPHPLWALPPVSMYAMGWSLMMPAITLLALDQVPERRGMASSVQSFLASVANALVAGVLSPLVMHSAWALAMAAAGMWLVGLAAWAWTAPRLETASSAGTGVPPPG
jgi:DHA1 family bicyclomycin/chloramphenicol resistance-like MFS transporter